LPDLITHTAVAYLASRPRSFARYRAVFYLGTILPDLISRPLYIIKPELFVYAAAIHTPVFLIVSCLLLAELFAEKLRSGVRLFLLAGVGLHLCLDLLQRHVASGYFWLFPFSWQSFEVGLFWPETPLSLAPLWIGSVLLTEVIIRLRKLKVKSGSTPEPKAGFH